jgi:hypothetical protein
MPSIDLFPALAIGECLDETNAEIYKAKLSGVVTKGQLVVWSTHTAGEIGSVVAAGLGAKNVAGMAMKSGVSGDIIPICRKGIVKVTGSGVIPLGSKVAPAASGAVIVSADLDAPAAYVEATMQTEFDKIEGRVGVAAQTFADTDTGLVLLDCPGE